MTVKNDIPESQYLAAGAKAAELLKTANYRAVWTKEYFNDRSTTATLQEKTLSEVIRPDKRRTVQEKFGSKPSREEIITDGTGFYFRTNDGPWSKRGLGNGSGVRFVPMEERIQVRFLPAVEFEGGKADFYEHVTIRPMSKASKNKPFVFRYVITTRSWFSAEGKILKKIVATAIEDNPDMARETTTYEYDPKDLKIEAPVIK